MTASCLLEREMERESACTIETTTTPRDILEGFPKKLRTRQDVREHVNQRVDERES
jgi:hypothetical protein